MTTLLQCHHLGFDVGSHPLFNDLNLTIRRGDRIGLVGHNGSGKSTLLALLDRALEPVTGEIRRARNSLCVRVEQYLPPQLASLSLWQALAERLPESMRQSDSYKVDRLLAEVGFAPETFDISAGDLSGGQQNRLLLARALLLEPDLLLLDEPSNHLDLESYLWLEQLLKRSQLTFVLVSHDRRLLDAVTRHTWWLRDQTVYHFAAPFSQARQALTAQDEAATARREVEEKEINRLQVSAKRLAVWGKVYDNEDLARKAKTMERRIERLEQEKTFVSRGSPLKLTLEGQSLKAKQLLTIEQARICIDGLAAPLVAIDALYIRPGERIALMGCNGSGKSTTIRALLAAAELNDDDASRASPIRFNPRCEVGYYDQEQALLDPDWDLDNALMAMTDVDARQRKLALIGSGFPYVRHGDRITGLSGGEKTRLMFTALALNSPHCLILDEPTNHLDIEGKEELEQQLCASHATVLLVSHDRELVEKTCQRFLVIHGGRLHEVATAEAAYALVTETSPDKAAPMRLHTPSSDTSCADDEESLLARLIELEELLEADQARKPRFQKPDRQRAWQSEIGELKLRLSL